MTGPQDQRSCDTCGDYEECKRNVARSLSSATWTPSVLLCEREIPKDTWKQEQMVPPRYCACGCGQVTLICTRQNKNKGYERGKRHKYISGHNSFARLYKVSPPVLAMRKLEANDERIGGIMSGVFVTAITDENREELHELCMSMYIGERCKFCGMEYKSLKDIRDREIVWAGYHEHGRSACKECWEA